MPLISVITPASRGVKYLSNLFRDLKNQTFRNFEHVCVFDGKVPDDVKVLVDQHKKLYPLKFHSISKDLGDMQRAPGTKARNYGTSIAEGEYACYVDDDLRLRDDYLEVHINGMGDKILSVIQAACAESRVYKDGKKDQFIVIPEIGLSTFPVICHIDTVSCLFPRKWILEDPWRYEPEHDFKLIKRIVEKHHPQVHIKNGIKADLDGLFTHGIRDWVSMPPFYRP